LAAVFPGCDGVAPCLSESRLPMVLVHGAGRMPVWRAGINPGRTIRWRGVLPGRVVPRVGVSWAARCFRGWVVLGVGGRGCYRRWS
jgi:hypothetical protein